MPKPPEPLVVIRAREFKAALLAREESEMLEMARRWLSVEERVVSQLTALARDLALQREEGVPVSKSALWRLDRFRRLQVQIEAEIQRYGDAVEGDIRAGQSDFAKLGIEHSAELIQLSYWDAGIVEVDFSRLPVDAVETMVGLACDGQPIGRLLRKRMRPSSNEWARLTDLLISATAQGWNPRKTARAMSNWLSGGLSKAMVIARSEQMRVYRLASIQQYQASGVVLGHKRLSAHNERVCAACLADEGTIYPVSRPIGDHPQGSCTSVPVVRGLPEITWTSGETWLRQQDEATQRAILGNGRFEAWKEGRFPLRAVVKKEMHPVWGESLRTASLSELLGA